MNDSQRTNRAMLASVAGLLLDAGPYNVPPVPGERRPLAGVDSPTRGVCEPVRGRAGPACGRNEPCPCGSGRKFKKCCRNKRP